MDSRSHSSTTIGAGRQASEAAPCLPGGVSGQEESGILWWLLAMAKAGSGASGGSRAQSLATPLLRVRALSFMGSVRGCDSASFMPLDDTAFCALSASAACERQ